MTSPSDAAWLDAGPEAVAAYAHDEGVTDCYAGCGGRVR